MAIASVMFNVPIFASLLRWLGCVEADGKVMSKVLETGQCFVLPDGIVGVRLLNCFVFCPLIIFLGAYHSSRTDERIFLKQRKGFVRIAIENQVPIIPVYCFGHTQLFDVYPTTSSWIVSLSRKVTKFHYLF